MIGQDGILARLAKLTGWMPPADRRELERYRAEQEARRRGEAAGEEVPRSAHEPSERDRWAASLGITFESQESPEEEAEAFLQALIVFEEKRGAEARRLREYAAGTSNDARRRSAENSAARIDAELGEVERWMHLLWGKTRSTRPLVNGEKDGAAALRCRCGCGRLFESSAARAANVGLHPWHIGERNRARAAVADDGPQSYVESLAARLI